MKKILTSISILLILFFKGQSDNITATPNPFSQRTLISYTVVSNDTISINVYDLTGLIVVPLRTDYIVAGGFYQDTLIIDNFPDGAYIVTLKNKQKTLRNLKIIKSLGTGIHEQNENNFDLRVYPNSLKDKLNLDFDQNKNNLNKLSITNTLGQMVFILNELKVKNEIDVSFLESGIYYLKVQNSDGQRAFKILKE